MSETRFLRVRLAGTSGVTTWINFAAIQVVHEGTITGMKVFAAGHPEGLHLEGRDAELVRTALNRAAEAGIGEGGK